jgi:hypothetical protein
LIDTLGRRGSELYLCRLRDAGVCFVYGDVGEPPTSSPSNRSPRCSAAQHTRPVLLGLTGEGLPFDAGSVT